MAQQMYINEPATQEQVSKLLELAENGSIPRRYFKKLTQTEAANLIGAGKNGSTVQFEVPSKTSEQGVIHINAVRLGMCFKLVYQKWSAGLATEKQVSDFKQEVRHLYEISLGLEIEMQQ